MFIDKILQESNAVLHAFLPGTSGGQGIVNALTGDYKIRPNGPSDVRNSLSFDWPRNTVHLYYIFSLNYQNSQFMLLMVEYLPMLILYLK
jgi:hypothetical protein